MTNNDLQNIIQKEIEYHDFHFPVYGVVKP